NRGVFSTKMKPSASAPASTAIVASRTFVMPQTLTRIMKNVGGEAPPPFPPRFARGDSKRPQPPRLVRAQAPFPPRFARGDSKRPQPPRLVRAQAPLPPRFARVDSRRPPPPPPHRRLPPLYRLAPRTQSTHSPIAAADMPSH